MKTNIFFSSLLVLLFSTSVFAHNKPTPTDIVKAYYTALDSGNSNGMEAVLADDFLAYVPFSPQPVPKQAFIGVGQGFKAAFSNMRHEVSSYYEAGSSVAVRGVFKGKNDGSMMGNPATNNVVALPFNSIYELNKDGKIKALYVQFDQKAMEAQLMAGLPSPAAQAEATVRDLFAAIDAGQVEKAQSYLSADFHISNPFLPQPAPVQVFAGILQSQKEGFPDLKHTILSVVTDGKSVATRGIYSGTNTGPMMGNPPTGNKVSLSFIVLDELDGNGKIKNRYVEFDNKAFEAQLMKSR